jgi:hypothetical protein
VRVRVGSVVVGRDGGSSNSYCRGSVKFVAGESDTASCVESGRSVLLALGKKAQGERVLSRPSAAAHS